jgi:hypothetical protein
LITSSDRYGCPLEVRILPGGLKQAAMPASHSTDESIAAADEAHAAWLYPSSSEPRLTRLRQRLIRCLVPVRGLCTARSVISISQRDDTVLVAFSEAGLLARALLRATRA